MLVKAIMAQVGELDKHVEGANFCVLELCIYVLLSMLQLPLHKFTLTHSDDAQRLELRRFHYKSPKTVPLQHPFSSL